MAQWVPAKTTNAEAALRVYNTTGSILVAGPKITASNPPTMAAATQALVDWHTALGIPTANILWYVVGESAT